MTKLRIMVCTRCNAREEDVPDVPDQRADLMALATVHFDKRPPYSEKYTEDTMYVVPHKRDCPQLARTLHDGGNLR